MEVEDVKVGHAYNYGSSKYYIVDDKAQPPYKWNTISLSCGGRIYGLGTNPVWWRNAREITCQNILIK